MKWWWERSLMFRATVLTTLVLCGWYWLLREASLEVLKAVSYLPLALLVAPSTHAPVRVSPQTGEWIFNVAIDRQVRNPSTGVMQEVSSIEFLAKPDNFAFFAVGWFAYLGMALSDKHLGRGGMRTLLRGLAWQTGLNILGVVLYVYVNGHGSVLREGDVSEWLLKYLYHLNYLVLPFLGPIVVAFRVHEEWREYWRRSIGPV